jgi:hypothetical protein
VNAGTLISRPAILVLTALSLTADAGAQQAKAHFVGPESRKPCHEAQYNGWTVTIFQNNNRKLDLLSSFEMPHTHTVAVDPKTHLVYFPAGEHRRPSSVTDYAAAQVGRTRQGCLAACRKHPEQSRK